MSFQSPLRHLLKSLCPPDLDGPSFDFIFSMVEEEAEFIQQNPRAMNVEQFCEVLDQKLADTLLSYEIVPDSKHGGGRPATAEFCAKLVEGMQGSNIVKLLDDSGEEAGKESRAGSGMSSAPAVLSSPVRLVDLEAAAAEERARTALEFTMADIQAAKRPWSAEEERVIFQRLADTNIYSAADDEAGMEELEGGCEMCGRDMPVTRHHLIPQVMHNRSPWSEMSKAHLQTCANICRPCHSAVHRFEDNKTLAQKFHTMQLLMADPRVQKWVAYISKQRVNRTKQQVKAGVKGLHYAK
jgi:hypothetical protein